MRDRWDEEEEELGRGRGRRREPEPEREATLGELIDNSVRRLVTGLVIAGGLIALGIWSGGRNEGGGSSAPDYQIATTSDGTVYRLNSGNGSIVACRNNRCWLMQRRSEHLDDGPPPKNATAAPAPAASPPAVASQPAPAQLPAPQNSAAPATP